MKELHGFQYSTAMSVKTWGRGMMVHDGDWSLGEGKLLVQGLEETLEAILACSISFVKSSSPVPEETGTHCLPSLSSVGN